MIDFPASPTDGQLFTTAGNGVVYKYSAAYSSWLAQNPAPAIGGTGDFYATGLSWPVSAPSLALIKAGTVVTGNSGNWYNPATGRYTPPAGRFSITGQIVVLNNTVAAQIILQLFKNGTVITQSSQTISTAGWWVDPSVEVILDCNGSDYFELWASSNTGASTANINFHAFPLTGLQGPTGPAGVTQTVFFETGALATGTTLIPADDTIPQITEGDQYMTLSITPQSATSKLIIDVTAFASNSAASAIIIVALFQDAAANALAVQAMHQVSPTNAINLKLTHAMTSGTTSLTTFRVRIGCNGGTTTFNGLAGARYFGGAIASSMVIREVP